MYILSTIFITQRMCQCNELYLSDFVFVVRKPKDTSGSPKKKGKKGGKKKNPWSDSEASESDKSDSDMDGSFMENLNPRVDRPKRETSKRTHIDSP